MVPSDPGQLRAAATAEMAAFAAGLVLAVEET